MMCISQVGSSACRHLSGSITVLGAFLPVTAVAQGFSAPKDPAQLLNSFINNQLGPMVTKLITDPNSQVFQIGWSTYLALSFFLGFILLVRFVQRGFEIEETIIGVLTIITVGAVMGAYSSAITLMWGIGDGVGFAVQSGALGNVDPYGPYNSMASDLNKLVLNPPSILSALDWVSTYIGLQLLNGLLLIASWLVNGWAVWGYALAKITGFFFVPLLLFDWTRKLFDGWLRLFLSFIVFNAIARIISVLNAMFVNFVVADVNPAVIFSDPEDSGVDAIMATSFLGLLLYIGAGVFAGMITGGFASSGQAFKALTGAVRSLKLA